MKASPEPQGELPARSERQSSTPQGPTTTREKATRDPGPSPLPTDARGPAGCTSRRSPLSPARGSHPTVTLGRELPDAVNELLQRRRHLGGWRRGRARYGRGGAGGCEGGGREGAARAGSGGGKREGGSTTGAAATSQSAASAGVARRPPPCVISAVSREQKPLPPRPPRLPR